MPEPFQEPRRISQAGLQKPLDALVDVPGILGAVVLTRDGLPVISQFEKLRRAETFVAMAAAALTAGEVMAGELNLQGKILFQVHHPQLTFAAMTLSEELIIVAFAEPDVEVERAFAQLRSDMSK